MLFVKIFCKWECVRWFYLLFLFIAVGCVKRETHWLYTVVPQHRSELCWYDPRWVTWMAFGNDDGGLFGENHPHPFHPDKEEGCAKAACWWARNPLHNFCYYVIGSADRVNSEVTLLEISKKRCATLLYKPKADRVFASEKSSFLFALHGGKPYLSLRICYNERYKGDFYLGWRYRGNFGIKFAPFRMK